MAILALHPGKKFEHVLSWDIRPEKIEPTEDNPEPDNSAHDDWVPTKWPLRVLDSKVRGHFKDKATKININPSDLNAEVSTDISQNEYYFKIVQCGLEAAPSNFDAPVKWGTQNMNIAGKRYEVVHADYIGCIPDDAIAELAETILSGNSITADEGNASA